MEISEIILFTLVLLIIYSYIIYPVILFIFGKLINKNIRVGDYLPRVTIIISAYNEEDVITAKLENTLKLEYPADSREIIVVSDCSDDNTDAIVSSYQDRGVVLLASKVRRGKTAGLNDAVSAAKGEVLVFTDADAMYSEDALMRMVRSLSDPNVGLVTGSTQYVSEESGQMVETSSIYTKLERFLKEQESKIGSCVGADGAIFALKKKLYKSLKDDDINDLVIPLKVIQQRYRVIIDRDLVCREAPSVSSSSEFNRQIRITNRTIRGIFRHSDLLNVLRYPLFSFQMLSHKLIRLSVPFFALLLLPLNIMLLDSGIVYWFIFISQLLFYVLSIIGYYKETYLKEQSTYGIFYHFVMVQIAILLGWINYFIGNKQVTWKPGSR